jgi:hypothetical protein
VDFLQPTAVWTLRALAAALAIAALTGCSGSSKELRTPAQAAGFVAEVAAGGPYDDWKLAGGASRQAVQAWAARARIGDLGRRLRDAAVLPPGYNGYNASWTCEMARNLVGLGSVGGVTSFDGNDVGIVTRNALQEGVKRDQIPAMIHDAVTVPFRDLAIATAVVCGPKVS